MALLFADGFDHYATADILKKWNVVQTVYGASPTIAATSGRRGKGALYFPNAAREVRVIKAISPSTNVLYIGFALYTGGTIIANQMLVHFWNPLYLPGQNLTGPGIGITPERYLSGFGITATSRALPINTWNYIEAKVTITSSTVAGDCSIRVNGEEWGTCPVGVDTRPAAGDPHYLAIGGVTWLGNTATNLYYFDDLYLCDSSGTTNNGFLGDIRIDTLYPTADGTYKEMAASTGTDHYALVDETAPSTADYVYSASAGARDTFVLGDLSLASDTPVFGVQVNNIVHKDDAGYRQAANLLRSGTTDSASAGVSITTSPLDLLSIHETDPATGGAWTVAAINALEAGTKVA